MVTLPFSPKPRYFFFFEGLEYANTEYGSTIYFKNINLQYFAILLDKNIIFANHYVTFKNYDNIFKKFCKKKSFNQTIRFVLEKLQKSGDL